MENVSKKIGYTFIDKTLLENALTHSTYCFQHDLKYAMNNQRLEFLGDSFLNAVIAEILYIKMPNAKEGELSRARAYIVCARSLGEVADELGLNDEIHIGEGEIIGKNRNLINAGGDAVEAIIGAVYLDGGFSAARQVIENVFSGRVEKVINGEIETVNFKNMLQEYFQQDGGNMGNYRIVNVTGPEHMRWFTAVFEMDGEILGRGEGHNKKEAETNAAEDALKKIGRL